MTEEELKALRQTPVPPARPEARAAALGAALQAFDEKFSEAPKGSVGTRRHSTGTIPFWRKLMTRNSIFAPALAGALVLPLAAYVGWSLMDSTSPLGLKRGEGSAVQQPVVVERERAVEETAVGEQQADVSVSNRAEPAIAAAPPSVTSEAGRVLTRQAAPAPQSYSVQASDNLAPSVGILPADTMPIPSENRDRIESFDTNPVRSTAEQPVSTFSIDTDTASYAFVRRSLREGVLPNPETVRVEEMVNYFPYDWQGPDSAVTPFRANVSVLPSPWREGTKLMHVAIKGYELPVTERPATNLVLLIDVSGSMIEPDKLPLLKSAFRLLVSKLDDRDTVSIVTYAGAAGTVLEPTRGSDRQRILAAIDALEPGGSTAGEAGIREAYRLAQDSFVKDGINRVMLATDGDFNVGQSSDEDLERLIEEKRKSGVFLSVLGFGRGNLNDRMMQAIAQNGNGTAAYIDTLAEAEKVLVSEATSTLFPIAKDVKIQVEFNPETIAEYRLIGYETRALNREDFNDDKVDAGEIGAGHSVTAIYEITPKGSPAQQIDDLRYGTNQAGSGSGEYAFVKIRYKRPDEDVSRLITQPVTPQNEVADFASASDDQRFSVAVAGFGQKLREAGGLSSFGYERIAEIAATARGADPFGYRSEFLSLVRLAEALEAGKR